MDINIDVIQPEEATPIELDVSTGVSYLTLDKKPQINGVELVGNKTAEDLGLQPKGDYIQRGEINIDGSISGDGFATKEELNKKANKSELSTVAFTGSYNDLTNRPTIPNMPTKTSQLTNDSGFLTQHQNISHLATKTELNNKQDKLVAGSNITIVNNVISAVGGNSSGGTVVDAYTKTETDNLLSEKQDKGNYALKSEIPTNVSQLNNDKGYLTEHQDISGKQDKLIAGNNITIVGNVISATGEITPSNGSSSTKTVGQIFSSLFPLEDAGLHLLDGSLINGDGIYKSFVDHIANLDLSSSWFMQPTPETNWTQPVITSNGTIGGSSFAVSATQSHEGNPAHKMFDNNTNGNWVSAGVEDDLILYNPTPIRIIKLGMTNRNESPVRPIANGTIYGSNDGNVYTEITSFTNTVETQSGTWSVDLSNNANYYKYYKLSLVGVAMYCSLNAMAITAKLIGATAEQNWQTFVQKNGMCGKFVYDSSANTVRLPKITGYLDGTLNPEILGDLVEINIGTSNIKLKGTKVYHYIVVATSTKTDIEVNIDNIVTDLNNKADKDGLYASTTFDNLTLGASGSTYVAPANGLFSLSKNTTASGQSIVAFINNTWSTSGISDISVQVKKGDSVKINYTTEGATNYFRFVYAESEVQ